MQYSRKSIADFTQELGACSPTPGGGTAAALMAATGAALVEMTARLNDARLGRVSSSAKKAAQLRVQLQRLMDEDAQAFEKIRKVYKFRKEKPMAWQAALKAGARAPLHICELCAGAAKLAKLERPRTSAWLESDRREALIFLQAAFQGARLNVEINLRSISDKAFSKGVKRKLRQWQRTL